MKWLSKKSLLICLTLLMLVVVVVSMIVTTGMPVREDAVNMVLDDWTTEQVIDPPDEPYYSGEKTVYQLVMSHKVTSEMRGKVISFRTNDSYVDAYLTDVTGTPEDDAVHIYHFGERLKICDSPGTYTHFIRLPESAVGQVTICVETVYANKFMPSYEVAIGTQNELLFNYLRQNLLSGISNVAMLLAGVLLLVIYTVGRAKHVSAPETLSLGCLSIVFAVNLNCPLFLNQFLYQNAVVQYYVNYFSLFLLPLLAMLYFEDIVPDLRIKWPFYSFLVLECVLSVLHFTGIASYTRTIKVFIAALGIFAVMFIVMIAKRYRQMEKINRISLLLLLAFVCSNVLFFIFVSTVGDQTFNVRTGFLLYLALSVVNGLRKLMVEMSRERETRLLQTLAYTDNLTKLGNRYALERDARKCVLERTSIVSMDLNLLKMVNDTFGHAGGDMLLQSAAKCMTSVYNQVYRVGGDEFIALLDGKDSDDLQRLYDRLKQKITEMNDSRKDYGAFSRETEFRLSIAVGYSAYAAGDSSYEQIMSRADAAMYAEKKTMHHGRSR